MGLQMQKIYEGTEGKNGESRTEGKTAKAGQGKENRQERKRAERSGMRGKSGKDGALKNRAAYFGVFTALALIFSYIETLIPFSFRVPGIKLGITNLLIVIFLYKRNAGEALLLSVVRIILSGFLFGNLFSILYSLAGGVLSLFVMALLKRTGTFSVVGVSVAGGISHNTGQLLVAMAVLKTWRTGYYFPVLLVAGTATGLLIGIVAREVLKRLGKVEIG